MAVETVAPPRSVLSDELIRACAERAAIYGRENRFFTDDFDALRAAGYLSGELQFVVTTTGFGREEVLNSAPVFVSLRTLRPDSPVHRRVQARR